MITVEHESGRMFSVFLLLCGLVFAYKVGKKTGYEDGVKDATYLIEFKKVSQK